MSLGRGTGSRPRAAAAPGAGGPGSRNGGTAETRFTIVYHHRVFADGARPLYRLGVAERVLAGQLDALARRGMRAVTVSEGLARLAEGRGGHWVAFSFDDGYADNVTRALPLLAAAGGRATFYLAAGLIERRTSPWWDDLAFTLATARIDRLRWQSNDLRYDLPVGTTAERTGALEALLPAFDVAPVEQAGRLASLREAMGGAAAAPCELATWDQARRLVEAGMEVGTHTLTHPFMSRLGAAEQEGEIAGSVDLIERRLGTRPRGLAYPGGDYDAWTLTAAARAGLEHAVTTRAGDNRADTPRLELRRRGLPESACLGPAGRFSTRMTLAELDGAFDGWRDAIQQGRA